MSWEYTYPLIAYLLGSIPFGLILSELFGNGDLRQKGSGNIGSTNVLRTQGKLLGALTLICDFLKAFLPCYFLKTDNEICNLLIIVAPTLGHIFPIWLKFKGGKGVASYLGTIAAIHWFILLVTGITWISVFKICKISSFSGLFSLIISLLVCGGVESDSHKLLALIFLVIVIFVKHKDNIVRLCNNEESRIQV